LILLIGYFLGAQIKDDMGRAFDDTGTDGEITLRWIFKNDGRAWTGFTWLSIETSGKFL
jgi:hypothetical protein